MDENEELDITVEDEKSLEEQLADLKSQVVTLTELVNLLYSEKDYELSYSGEQVDEVCEKVLNITPSAAEINTSVKQTQDIFAPIIKPGVSYGVHIMTEAEALLRSNNGADISSLFKLLNTNGLKDLVLKWGSFTKATHVNSDSGSQSTSSSHSISVPSNTTDIAIFAMCDFANAVFDNTQFSYSADGSKFNYTIYLHHSSDQGGDYNFKVYYLLIGKRTGGGKIG